MAGKKIGIVLALDGEKQFTQGVQNAKKESAALKAELKKLSVEYDGNANSMEYLQKKQDVLTRQQENYDKKLKTAQAGLNKANTNLQKQSDRLADLKSQLDQASKSLDEMKQSGKEGSKEYENQEKKIRELTDAVERQEIARNREIGSISDWTKKINESEAELKKANREIQNNAKYLAEAEISTDKCAKSIDQYGTEVEDAIEVTTSLGDKLKTALVTKGVDIAVDGIRMLGDAAKEAAEYAVEVGSSFETAMSEVAAISGATGDQLDAMEEKAKELGSTTKFSATEAAEAFKYMSLAGWSTSDMLSGIDGVMNLAAASGMDLANASDMVTDYLSAFGMQASESAYMADLLAYAQSHSNTTAEQLGEAYKNSAANMHSAGQDIETTTSLLEAMANQGLKGSEAGTALSAMMRDITAKMKDGKIAIGNTSVAVMDVNGNYRDLTDILSDVEDATEGMGSAEKNAALQSTFTADSIKGLNLVLADGMQNVSDYEEALRGSEGAAQKMADTMQDNLKGKMTEMDSALEGLGIAAYDYVSGPLSGVVEGVTGVINGITDAITPQKTELETFIDDVKASNDEVGKLIESAGSTVSGAEVDVSGLEAYKKTLMSLNDVQEKDEFQKYQIKNAVDALSESIPELAAAYDSESGSIKLTNDQIERLIDNQEELIMQQAMESAKKEYLEAYAQSKIEEAKATDAQKKAQEDYNKVLDEYNSKLDEFASSGMDTSGLDKMLGDSADILNDANKELERAQKNTDDAKNNIDELESALSELNDAQKENVSVSDADMQRQEQLAMKQLDAADAASEAAGAIEGNTEALSENAQTAEEAAKAISDAYSGAFDDGIGAYESAKESMKNGLEVDFLSDEFDGGVDLTVEKMLENADTQLEGLKKYQENLAEVRDHVGKEIAPEFLAYLESLGTDGANILEHICRTFEQDNGSELVEQWSDKYLEKLSMQDEISTVLANDKVALDSGLSELGSTDIEWAGLEQAFEDAQKIASDGGTKTSQEAINAFNEASSAAQQVGVAIPQNLADGLSSGQVSIENATDQLNAAIQGRFDGLAEIARQQGIEIPPELAAGIEEGGQSAVDAYNELITLLAGLKTEAQAAGTESGDASVTGYKESLENGKSDVTTAGDSLANAGADAAAGKKSDYEKAGIDSGKAYADALRAQLQQAVSAGNDIASAARSALASYQNSFYNTGYYMSEGVAQGIRAGKSQAVNAAIEMAREALAAAKKELGINSPSRKFRKDVGEQVGKGFAYGIKDSASLAGKEAGKMSNKVYTSAVSWMSKYKKKQNVSLEDEKYYWEQVAKHLKKGTTAYQNAQKKINQINNSMIGNGVAKKISNNFGVSRTETVTTGSGKNKKTSTKNKSDADYYSELYSAAAQTFSNFQVLEDLSLAQQEAYWEEVLKKMKKHTQGWYDSLSRLKTIREKQAEEESEYYQKQIDRVDAANEALDLKSQQNVNKSVQYAQKKLKNWENQLSKIDKKANPDEYAKVEKNIISAYDDIVSAAEQYVKNKKILGKMSAQQEKEYWEEIQKSLKKGTQAWYDSQEKINDAKDRIAEESEEKYEKIVSSTESYIEKQGILGKMSAKREESLWDQALTRIERNGGKYTDAWYTARSNLNQAKDDVASDNEAALEKIVSSTERYIRKKDILGKMSASKEQKLWEEALKKIEDGGGKYTDAWYTVKSKLNQAEEDVAAAKEEKYNKIVSDAEEYIRKQKILGKMTAQQELEYWQSTIKSIKKGTDAWYAAKEKIKDLKEEIADDAAQAAEDAAQKAKDALTTTASVQSSILSKYKTYYKVSAKAEVDYWNIARQQFKAGTDERIEADQNYLDALQEWYDQRKDLDEEYAENSKSINDELIDNIQDLEDAYKDAVASRKQDILSQMNLFEAWDSEGYDSDTLLYNLKTQVAGLTLWEQQLEELGKKGLSSELMDELKSMGPDAAASIYSLNQMTAEQLDEYNKLWEQKNALAESQAVKDNEQLRIDSNNQITQLRLDAQAELNSLNAEYRAALQELNTGISSDLANLVNQAKTIGEDAVSGLIAGIGKAANSVETYNSTTQVVNTVSAQLSALKQEGDVIGKKTLDGLLGGLQNQEKIRIASQNVIQSIKRAMEEEAEIHSPSRLFRRETGKQIPAGVALGMEDGTKQAIESAQEMMRNTLAAAQEEMQKQQAAMQERADALDFSGIARLNRLTEQYTPQTPVVNVDNRGLISAVQQITAALPNMIADALSGMQMVTDTGVLAGQLQPLISRETAAITVRRNRGRR